ncbi:hypothetical protein ACQEVS_09835 [Streptomyces sp. CA-181903]|uniref:hypothetical protein n=1 Tax=Streptomyces sp. CA-181903 TaxID=3240055 RepID=UPI003D8A34EC
MTHKELAGLAADLDALTEAPATRKGPPCSVAVALASVDEETAATLCRTLDTPTIPSTAIAAVLSQHGRAITAYTVARHRRRGEVTGCRCPAGIPAQRPGSPAPARGEAPSAGLLVFSVGPDGWDPLRLL